MDHREIRTHIAGHGTWKARLREALADGAHGLSADEVRPDDRCAFGKWLRAQPPAIQASTHWKTARDLHRSFHEEAAEVVLLIQRGERDAADRSISMRGKLSRATSALTLSMVDWMDDRAGDDGSP